MKRYLYKGRHRAPTNHGKRIAVVGSGAVLLTSVGMTPAQAASMPDNIRAAIIACESGNRNINNTTYPVSTASGYYQITNGTWARYGGKRFASRAISASRSEQNAIADAIYTANGLRDWNASRSCWAKRIPNAANSKPTTSKNAAKRTADVMVKVTPKTARSVVVKRGDTLSRIASANRVSGGWQKLYASNRNVVENPNLIFPGERLTLPK